MSILLPPKNILQCSWGGYNHVLFQLANFWLLTLYVGDFLTFPSLFHYTVFLRVVLSCSAGCFCFWGFWILCSPDTGSWNLVFLLYNLVRLSLLLYNHSQGVSVQPKFSRLYNYCYKTAEVDVATYNELISLGLVWTLKPGDDLQSYIAPNKLVQIISGKVAVILENGTDVKLKDGDFINYFNFSESDFIKDHLVLTETIIIIWYRSQITEHFTKKRFAEQRYTFSYVVMRNTNATLVKILQSVAKPPPPSTSLPLPLLCQVDHRQQGQKPEQLPPDETPVISPSPSPSSSARNTSSDSTDSTNHHHTKSNWKENLILNPMFVNLQLTDNNKMNDSNNISNSNNHNNDGNDETLLEPRVGTVSRDGDQTPGVDNNSNTDIPDLTPLMESYNEVESCV